MSDLRELDELSAAVAGDAAAEPAKVEWRMLKYPLFDLRVPGHTSDTVRVQAPPSSGINRVGVQRGVITLWSLVDVLQASIERQFFVVGTGQPLPFEGCWGYLGTVELEYLVWHVFELVLPSARALAAAVTA